MLSDWMKSWKLSLVGVLFSFAIVFLSSLQSGGVSWKDAAIAGGLAAVSILAKQFNVSTAPPAPGLPSELPK